MLRNDEKAKQEERKQADMESLTKACEISAELEMPKMLATVAKVLDPNSNTGRKLNTAIGWEELKIRIIVNNCVCRAFATPDVAFARCLEHRLRLGD